MAERKSLINIEYISDHSCGTYRVGEIDTSTNEPIYNFVRAFGEFGYTEILDMTAKMNAAAVEAIRDFRNFNQPTAMQAQTLKG